MDAQIFEQIGFAPALRVIFGVIQVLAALALLSLKTMTQAIWVHLSLLLIVSVALVNAGMDTLAIAPMVLIAVLAWTLVLSRSRTGSVRHSHS